MDEPTSALDGDASAELETLMRALATDGVPVLLVTHDEAQLERVADHVLRLATGGSPGAGAPPWVSGTSPGRPRRCR